MSEPNDLCVECDHPKHAHSKSVGQGISHTYRCRATIFRECEQGGDAWPCPCRKFVPVFVPEHVEADIP